MCGWVFIIVVCVGWINNSFFFGFAMFESWVWYIFTLCLDLSNFIHVHGSGLSHLVQTSFIIYTKLGLCCCIFFFYFFKHLHHCSYKPLSVSSHNIKKIKAFGAALGLVQKKPQWKFILDIIVPNGHLSLTSDSELIMWDNEVSQLWKNW